MFFFKGVVVGIVDEKERFIEYFYLLWCFFFNGFLINYKCDFVESFCIFDRCI